MATTLALLPGTVPAGTCIPGDIQSLVNLFTQYVTVQQVTDPTINTGPATPPASKQDRPWIRTDANGAPLGTWIFYGGRWVKDWGGMRAGAIVILDGISVASFDGTGLATDGNWVGWALCNGNNGTSDLRDKFVLCAGVAHVENSSGGAETHALTSAENGPHSHVCNVGDDIDLGLRPLFATADDEGGTGTINTETSGLGTPHNNMPPYYSKAYIKFIGY